MTMILVSRRKVISWRYWTKAHCSDRVANGIGQEPIVISPFRHTRVGTRPPHGCLASGALDNHTSESESVRRWRLKKD